LGAGGAWAESPPRSSLLLLPLLSIAGVGEMVAGNESESGLRRRIVGSGIVGSETVSYVAVVVGLRMETQTQT
jgi:hypothetical protein